MFIKLTTRDGTKVYNTEYVRSFYKENNHTVLELEYGTEIVKERLEEIMEMLKGSN